MSNHGKLLLPTTPLEDCAGTALDGKPVSLNGIRGRWTLLYALRWAAKWAVCSGIT